MLQIHNSLTGRKEPFTPLVEGEARMYVCGITVYDYIHVGHARSQIAFDVVRRWLRASGYRVTYVRNITDVDDKIIQRARERGKRSRDSRPASSPRWRSSRASRSCRSRCTPW